MRPVHVILCFVSFNITVNLSNIKLIVLRTFVQLVRWLSCFTIFQFFVIYFIIICVSIGTLLTKTVKTNQMSKTGKCIRHV